MTEELHTWNTRWFVSLLPGIVLDHASDSMPPGRQAQSCKRKLMLPQVDVQVHLNVIARRRATCASGRGFFENTGHRRNHLYSGQLYSIPAEFCGMVTIFALSNLAWLWVFNS